MSEFTIFKAKITLRKSVDSAIVREKLSAFCTENPIFEDHANRNEYAVRFEGHFYYDDDRTAMDKFLSEILPHTKDGFVFFKRGTESIRRIVFDPSEKRWVKQVGGVRFEGRRAIVQWKEDVKTG